ncbi:MULTISPECIES: hypothetical protein [Ruminococcus]|uniref:Uncharacterized protein n=1 Tax=Ruminococcus flavefaciens TaxID=1265 RepID=A0A1M7J172_RUMFL|nr:MULTISPECIES: hypothetical protein [Ruminococcus]MCR4795980.1 hypothetical protein [Ruminococcus sp.]SHM46814.1 hypothetical protein SAMN04487860_10575 [Ruminococcus flavefaciens]
MRYTILDIIEWDYGCEGVPDGEEPMCSVVVRDESNNEKVIKLSDSYLTENHLKTGDTIEL